MPKRRLPRGITRRDDATSRTCGWQVFAQRRGTRVIRLFSDRKWGGRAKALTAARRFRARWCRAHPALTLANYCAIRKRNNRSGIPGVCRLVQPRPSGGRSVYWVASCPTTRGKPRHIKFSVATLSERGARENALVARRRALRALARLPVRRSG